MITAKYKKTWTKAIEKCLKQKSYFDGECALCLATKRTTNKTCSQCICHVAPPHEGCIRRFDGRALTFRACRAELRQMLEWLKKQKVKKGVNDEEEK